METLPLFVYGTLRRGQCNHSMLRGRFSRSLAAELTGFTRVHPLMIVERASGDVDGELYFLHADQYLRTMAECDELEEVPAYTLVGPDYRRLKVDVLTEKGTFAAWAYVHAGTPDRRM